VIGGGDRHPHSCWDDDQTPTGSARLGWRGGVRNHDETVAATEDCSNGSAADESPIVSGAADSL
jgi:hypothetical protein